MSSVNKVILIGNLGADPELKYTTSNRAVCNLSVATNEKFKTSSGQLREKTEWHRVIVWGDTAENAAKFLKKGRSVYLEGKIQTSSWDDKKTGEKKYKTEIVADRVVFLSGKGETGEGGGSGAARRGWGEEPVNDAQEPPPGAPPSQPDLTDDNIPF